MTSDGNGLVSHTYDIIPIDLRDEQNHQNQSGGIKASVNRVLRNANRTLFRRRIAGEGVDMFSGPLSGPHLLTLGVGSTLGVGVYMLAGDVAKNYAGPAVILSFLLAALLSLFAGLCYREFGARAPRAGTGYVYCYVFAGELVAFVIGWDIILVFIMGAASGAKAISEYIDALVEIDILENMTDIMPPDSPYLAHYPDLLAFLFIMLFSVALAFGVKKPAMLNYLCIGVNLCVVLFVIISGCYIADIKNWNLNASTLPITTSKKFGSGGFAPYGVDGIIKGATYFFFWFIAFDCVATASRDVRRPREIGAGASLLVVFVVYCGVLPVLTLMLPYYLQDETLPISFIYGQLGWTWATYAVHVGAFCAFYSSILGTMFPLSRLIYAMASDGLLFPCLGRINERFETPIIGITVAGLVTGTVATIFKLEQLILMMSIGTLFAYFMFASCVLRLRYEYTPSPYKTEPLGLSFCAVLRQLVNADRLTAPTRLSSAIVTVLVTLYGIWCFMMMSSVYQYGAALASEPGALATFCCGLLLVLATLYAISRQPVSQKQLDYSVPMVPWLPGLSILITVYLILNLDYMTWVGFAVWIAAGLLIYAAYGAWHSSVRRRMQQENLA